MGNQTANCAYCGRTAGRTEAMYLWQANVACRDCYQQLAQAAASALTTGRADDEQAIPLGDEERAQASSQAAAIAPQPVMPLSYARPPMGPRRYGVAPAAREAQSNIATILLILAILQFIGAGCIGLLAVLAGGLLAGSPVGNAAIALVFAFALAVAGLGVAYLICRSKILEGSRTAAIVAIVLAGCHLALNAFGLINTIVQSKDARPANCIAVLISVVIIVALILLIANLAKFLKATGMNAGY